jgi:hypothetical protein
LKNELDAKMIKLLDHQIHLSRNKDDANRQLSFYQSFLPSLSSHNDDETLEFQPGVISVLQNIKRKKDTQFNNLPHHSTQQTKAPFCCTICMRRLKSGKS